MDWLDELEPIIRHKDRRSPLYLRITERIRACIEAGRLTDNEKLLPDRELAKLLNLDRSTIARAYDQLSVEGLVYSHVGRGTFVQKSSQPRARYDKHTPANDEPIGEMVWGDKYSRASQSVASIVNRQVPSSAQNEDCISFAAGSPTEEFFPQNEFRQIVEELLSSASAQEMFGYSEPEGQPELRKQVQTYLRKQGIEAKSDEILILSGSQQGIDLVARTLLNPDDVVLMEDPSYFWALCNFTATGARCLPISMDDEGLRLDLLESIASRVDAKLLYTMPSFQNPTGITMSESRRKKVLELAAKFQIPILEDNFVGDLDYSGFPRRSLKSLDENGCVIYQGTLSKALCPGLRLGWLVAPAPVMSRLRLAKRTCDLSTNSMGQVILAEYLNKGLYESHLSMVQEEYGRRLDTICSAIDGLAAQWISYRRPDGGMFLWATLPPGYSARELLSYAEREGVTYSPGDVFHISSGRSECLRLTFIQQTPELIQEGIRRLAKALKAYGNNRKRTRGEGFRVTESTFI